MRVSLLRGVVTGGTPNYSRFVKGLPPRLSQRGITWTRGATEDGLIAPASGRSALEARCGSGEFGHRVDTPSAALPH